ncbi:MAG: helix-turn-helix domain-containing protein [Nitrospirae bacterium]|nr:helix-turn-helix domain-containing protein [Nitrospirota bacterium]
MANNDISQKIRELRKSLKLTQSQFAKLVHLSVDRVGKIERGIGGDPTVETLENIADALKMPVEDLIYPTKKKTTHKPTRELADLIAYLQTRTPADIKFIHELAIKILEKK